MPNRSQRKGPGEGILGLVGTQSLRNQTQAGGQSADRQHLGGWSVSASEGDWEQNEVSGSDSRIRFALCPMNIKGLIDGDFVRRPCPSSPSRR